MQKDVPNLNKKNKRYDVVVKLCEEEVSVGLETTCCLITGWGHMM